MAPLDPTSPKRKSLFKRRAVFQTPAAGHEKPAPAADNEGSSADELDIFRRSRHSFPKATYAQEKSLKPKPEGGKADKPQKSGGSGAHDQKRRKVAVAEEDSDDIYGVSDRELERRARISLQR